MKVWKRSIKCRFLWSTPPHLHDYEQVCASFQWDEIRREFVGLPNDAGLNLAYEAVDRHLGAKANRLALRWLGKSGQIQDYTYADISQASNRFANALRQLNIAKGERVFSLLGRVPALYFAALGTLKNTSVFCPLFSQFGPEPICQRLQRGDAKVLVTTLAAYEKKIVALRERLPQLTQVLLVDVDDDIATDVRSLPKLLAAASADFTVPPTSPEDAALLHFTSGQPNAERRNPCSSSRVDTLCHRKICARPPSR